VTDDTDTDAITAYAVELKDLVDAWRAGAASLMAIGADPQQVAFSMVLAVGEIVAHCVDADRAERCRRFDQLLGWSRDFFSTQLDQADADMARSRAVIERALMLLTPHRDKPS
jgi:hypothetical protein